MTHQDEIDALLTEAAPLRLLPDDEAEAKGLPALVDKINWLRKCQGLGHDEVLQPGGLYDAISNPPPGIPATGRRNKPGPKPRATVEGADAP
jgi:hypothetical protein